MASAPEDPGLRVGVYRHHGGDHYLVLGVARDATYRDEDRLLVIYTRLYGRPGPPLNARPIEAFTEMVDGPNGPVPRFTWIGYADSTERDDPTTAEAK